MSGWRGWDGEEGDGGGGGVDNTTKIAFGIGAGLGLLVLGWMMFARAGEENISSSGFSDGGAGVAAPPFSSARRDSANSAFARRSGAESSLSSATVPSGALLSVRPETIPGPAAGAEPSGAAPAAPAAAGQTPEELSEEDKAAARSHGVPKTPRDLAQLGMDAGVFKTVFQGLSHYPKVVGYLLNNSYVVDGYMNRESSKKVFGNPDGMKQYLSDVGGPVSTSLPLFQAFLKENPELASVVAGSALVAKIQETPGFKGFVSDPAATVIANPAVLGLLTDPQIIQGISANPSGAAALAAIQKNSSLNH